jgi:hypothetical protein
VVVEICPKRSALARQIDDHSDTPNSRMPGGVAYINLVLVLTSVPFLLCPTCLILFVFILISLLAAKLEAP